MFAKTETSEMLDAEIQSALAKLKTLEKNSEEYGILVDRITKLHKLKGDDDTTELKLHESLNPVAPPSPRKPLSLDTALVVGANLFGILWLARYERDHVIKAPNAFRNIMKP